MGPIGNKSALIQVMACRLFGASVDPGHWRIYAALRGDELSLNFYKLLRKSLF